MSYENIVFNIIIPIVSAIIGGGLTLLGVAWTIHNSEKRYQKNEKEKAKPLFTSGFKSEKQLYSGIIFTTKTDPKNVLIYKGNIINSDNSNFYVESVLDGFGNEITPSTHNVILKNQEVMFYAIGFLLCENALYVTMRDIFDKKYHYRFNFEKQRDNDGEHLWLTAINSISREDYAKIKAERTS